MDATQVMSTLRPSHFSVWYWKASWVCASGPGHPAPSHIPNSNCNSERNPHCTCAMASGYLADESISLSPPEWPLHKETKSVESWWNCMRKSFSITTHLIFWEASGPPGFLPHWWYVFITQGIIIITHRIMGNFQRCNLSPKCHQRLQKKFSRQSLRWKPHPMYVHIIIIHCIGHAHV